MPINENSPPTMSLTIAPGERGTNRQITAPDGQRRASLFSTTAVMESPLVGPSARRFDQALADAAALLVGSNQDGYTGKALDAEKQRFLATVKPPLKNLIHVASAARAEHQERYQRILSWDRQAEPNSNLRSDLRNWLLSHKVPERVRLLLDADHALVVVALEGGQRVAGVDSTVWTAFLDHAACVLHVHRAGLAANHQRAPSLDDLTAAGVDMDAALADANKSVAAHKADGDVLNLTKDYLSAAVNFIAFAADVKPEQVIE